jgi:ATP-dependent Clp protease ATP-binding subunit ClpA
VNFTQALEGISRSTAFDPLDVPPHVAPIQDTIRRVLADELLFGKLATGGRITVDVDADGKVHLEFQAPEETPDQEASVAS